MTKELEKLRKYGELIEKLIRPASFPLAVKLIQSETEILPEYKRPSRDMGLQNFVTANPRAPYTDGIYRQRKK